MAQRPYVQKDEMRNRLAKIEGQLAGLRRMQDEERLPQECLEQVSAIRSALDQYAARVLARYLSESGVGPDVSFDDMLALTRRLVH
ncbi:MAG: metal-sensing transcriptional repressor [Fimbriimonas sp.]|nr:metal-sensing transcriptional repressor [Fimbriimonas sp.]